MLKIKRVLPLSLAKITGVIAMSFGLIIGVIMTFMTIVAGGGNDPMQKFMGYIAFIIAPLGYGMIGFLMGLIQSWLFNLAAKRLGGLEIETE
ncbi:MAG: hypothetical protein HQL24_01005 [Candidatus Omnitrophica bacterium]|nr:hypothetical protein [Candidatus Omnitrophota bacterium]